MTPNVQLTPGPPLARLRVLTIMMKEKRSPKLAGSFWPAVLVRLYGGTFRSSATLITIPSCGVPLTADWKSVLVALQILWRQSRPLGNSREHSRADFLAVMKRKNHVGPAGT